MCVNLHEYLCDLFNVISNDSIYSECKGLYKLYEYLLNLFENVHTVALPHTTALPDSRPLPHSRWTAAHCRKHCRTLPHTLARTAGHHHTASHCMNQNVAHHTPHTANRTHSFTSISMYSNNLMWVYMNSCEFMCIYLNLCEFTWIKTILFECVWICMNINMIYLIVFQIIWFIPNLYAFIRIYLKSLTNVDTAALIHTARQPHTAALPHTLPYTLPRALPDSRTLPQALPHTAARTAGHCCTAALLHELKCRTLHTAHCTPHTVAYRN
jgi:hypothetical protein